MYKIESAVNVCVNVCVNVDHGIIDVLLLIMITRALTTLHSTLSLVTDTKQKLMSIDPASDLQDSLDDIALSVSDRWWSSWGGRSKVCFLQVTRSNGLQDSASQFVSAAVKLFYNSMIYIYTHIYTHIYGTFYFVHSASTVYLDMPSSILCYLHV